MAKTSKVTIKSSRKPSKPTVPVVPLAPDQPHVTYLAPNIYS